MGEQRVKEQIYNALTGPDAQHTRRTTANVLFKCNKLRTFKTFYAIVNEIV